ncbi:MAG: CoA pyrophosphatase [Rhodospirillales bacterium]|nr:CoA pyrophosphatase [Rhodospirillales bacterium]
MQADILRGVAQQAPGAPDQPWEAVIAAAERAPAARVPGSLRHSEESWGRLPTSEPITPAAVLVAVIEREGAHSVLLTRRAERLARHAGQISFPGGRADPGDGTPQKTALREAEEEIGLPQANVQIMGRLDDYLVGTGYRITPVVGFVAAPPAFEPDTQEVAEVFEVPLPFVMDPANYGRDKLTVGGVERRFYVLPYGAYHIWGATAAILVNFRDAVRGSC